MFTRQSRVPWTWSPCWRSGRSSGRSSSSSSSSSSCMRSRFVYSSSPSSPPLLHFVLIRCRSFIADRCFSAAGSGAVAPQAPERRCPCCFWHIRRWFCRPARRQPARHGRQDTPPWPQQRRCRWTAMRGQPGRRCRTRAPRDACAKRCVPATTRPCHGQGHRRPRALALRHRHVDSSRVPRGAQRTHCLPQTADQDHCAAHQDRGVHVARGLCPA